MGFISPPAPDRTIVQGKAHLRDARGIDRSFGLMKAETTLVPVEPAMGQEFARFALEILHHVLVSHFQKRFRRQDRAPMRHHVRLRAIEMAKPAQVARVGYARAE